MRFYSLYRAALFPILLCWVSPLWALHPHLQTADTDIASPGGVEFWMGYLYTEKESRALERAQPVSVLHVGVMENQELSVEAPYRSVLQADGSSNSGWGDATIGWTLVGASDKDGGTGTAASFRAKLDNGDQNKGLGTGAMDFDFRLELQKTMGAFTRYLNGGYTFVGEPVVNGVKQDRKNAIFMSLAQENDLTSVLGLVGEVVFETARVPGDSNVISSNVGLRWSVGDFLRVYAVGGRSLRPGAKGGPRVRGFLGISLTFDPRAQKDEKKSFPHFQRR